MAKIAVTPSIVVAEFVLYRKKVSWPKVSALTLVVHVYLILISKKILGLVAIRGFRMLTHFKYVQILLCTLM